MSVIPMRPLGFGEILDGAFQLYRRDFLRYYLMALVPAFPGYLFTVTAGVDFSAFEALSVSDDLDATEVISSMGEFIAVYLVSALLLWFGSLAVTAAMADRIEGRSFRFWKAFGTALGRLPSAFGATALSVVTIMALGGILVMVVSAGMALAGGWLGVVGIAFAAVAIMAVLVALALFWIGATFAIMPAAIVERRGSMDTLKRSWQLFRGAWLRVIGIMLVVWVIVSVPGFAVGSLLGLGAFWATPDSLGQLGSLQQWVLTTASFVVDSLVVPISVGSVMMLFHDRRVRTEGYDIEALAGSMAAG